MIHRSCKITAQTPGVTLFLGAVAMLLGLIVSLNAQGQRKGGAQADEKPPSFNEYRGVQLGMMAEDVRKKLGEPQDQSNEQDFFVFNETETAQIIYDKGHKVVTISADFMSPGSSAPTFKQVFGAEIAAKPDGSIYKMTRYPKAGYWLSYNRTAGDSPLTTVTLQKIEQ